VINLLTLAKETTLDFQFEIDSSAEKRYDTPVFRLAGRSRSWLRLWIEESPHSIEHGAGETPGRENLPEQGHRNRQPLQSGHGEKVV